MGLVAVNIADTYEGHIFRGDHRGEAAQMGQFPGTLSDDARERHAMDVTGRT